jgi:hypothetical protein
MMPRPLRAAVLSLSPSLALLVALVLSGCEGQASLTPGPAPTAILAQVTATATHTVSNPEPTATIAYRQCPDGMSQQPDEVHSGDLLLSPAQHDLGAIYYQVPDNTPLKPLALPDPNANGPQPSWPKTALGVTDIYFQVCNTSATQTHTVQQVRVKITSFASYTAQLNAWDFCDGWYSRQVGVNHLNCDRGDIGIDPMLQASFGSTTVGLVASATGGLPVSLPPKALIIVGVTLTTPASAPGIYSFAANITSEGATSAYSGATTFLQAPIAHTWSGTACTKPAMISQIPAATNPPTLYICPES